MHSAFYTCQIPTDIFSTGALRIQKEEIKGGFGVFIVKCNIDIKYMLLIGLDAQYLVYDK